MTLSHLKHENMGVVVLPIKLSGFVFVANIFLTIISPDSDLYFLSIYCSVQRSHISDFKKVLATHCEEQLGKLESSAMYA